MIFISSSEYTPVFTKLLSGLLSNRQPTKKFVATLERNDLYISLLEGAYWALGAI